MKVLQIHDKDLRAAGATGGTAVYLIGVVDAMRRRDCEIATLRFTGDAPRSTEPTDGSYELHSSCFRMRQGVLATLQNILDREKPDVIHLHSATYALHPKLLRRLIQAAPLIATFHDVTPLCFRHNKLHRDGRLCEKPIGFGCLTSRCYRLGETTGLLRDGVRVLTQPARLKALQKIPMVVTPSRYLAEQFQINGFPPDNMRVVPQFSRFNIVENTVTVDPQSPTILFVGRLIEDKGILALIEMLARIKNESWRAIVVGDGPLRTDAIRLAATQGIEQRVNFSGEAFGEALQRQYRSCDLVVLPSLIPESFGLVGVESMAFGKPVVAFRSGGVGEWLEDGQTGYLAEHDDVDQLADRTARLLRDPALRKRMGEVAIRSVRERFTLDCHVDRLLELYGESIACFERSQP